MHNRKTYLIQVWYLWITFWDDHTWVLFLTEVLQLRILYTKQQQQNSLAGFACFYFRTVTQHKHVFRISNLCSIHQQSTAHFHMSKQDILQNPKLTQKFWMTTKSELHLLEDPMTWSKGKNHNSNNIKKRYWRIHLWLKSYLWEKLLQKHQNWDNRC